MKKILCVAIICLTSALTVFAQESATLDITGPSSWSVGAPITLSVQNTFTGLAGGGSYGLDYFLEVNSAIAPFLSITGLSHFTFTDAYNGPFPILFDNPTAPGFVRESTSLGGSSEPALTLIPNGSYHITDITITLAPGAPIGSYTLRTNLAIQTNGNFQDVTIPQTSFIFTVVPEPNTLALLGIGAIGSTVLAFRRRRHRDGAMD